jgi:phosphotransferase system enzyme I (PtsI)
MSGQLKGEKVFRGIAVSDGVCKGKILVLHHTRHVIARREIPDSEIEAEVRRFEQSLVRTRQQITDIQHRVAASMSAAEADIFDAHLLMLEDRVLIEEVIRAIRDQKVNAEFAFHTVSERYIAALADVDDEYLRERAADLGDLAGRVLDNLFEVKDTLDLRRLAEPCILVAHDLSPSTTAQLDKKLVLGFATDVGGKTSHTAIMARSLDIPAVVGLQTASEELATGHYALLDGYNGILIVNPTDQTLFEYGQLVKIKESLEVKLREIRSQPAVTLDGQRVHLSANIEDQNDIPAVLEHGAEGVGLFRPAAHRRGAGRGVSPSGRRAQTAAGHHPHARSGRRQVCLPSGIGPRSQSLSGLAGHPLLPGPAGIVPRPTSRHSARQRRRQRQNHVPHDFRSGGIDPGQCLPRKMQDRVARRENPL